MGILVVLIPVVFILVWLGRPRHTPEPDATDDPCLECGYDLRFSKIRCPECGSPIPRRATDHFPLRDDWPATPITPRVQSPDETPVMIRSTTNPMEASLIRDQFIARGIACWSRWDNLLRSPLTTRCPG